MNILGQAEAQKCIIANTPPRMLQLTGLRRYVDGSQYEGRPKWWDKSVPVWDREPCVVWHAAEGAIGANEDFLLGEGRYPAVTTRPDEDQGDDDEELDEEPSEKLDKFILCIEKEAKLRAHLREEYRDAQSVGSNVGLFGVRNGRLFSEVIRAEWATPLYIDGALVQLEISYPYIDIYKDQQGRWNARALIYRRVIDAERDVTFLPGMAMENGIEPNWQEDPGQTVVHGLGFCPAIYHKFRTVASIVNQKDGTAIHSQLIDELDSYNLEASMRHEGAVYSLPQKWETGVDPGYNPTNPTAQGLIVIGSLAGGPITTNNPATEAFRRPPRGAPQGARKQGPGEVWQYDSDTVKVGQLELNAGALQALADTMADLRARICETLAWVPLNPEEIKFAAALSGKALERILARQINRVAKDRDGFGDGYIKPAYCILLRIAQKLGAGIKTRGFADAKSALDSFEQESAEWTDPPLTLRWGAWFQPIPEDEQLIGQNTIALKEAGIITLRSAVEKNARSFSIENVDAYLDTLEEEAQKRRQEAQEDMANSMAKFHDDTGLDDSSGKPGGNRSRKPKANPQGGARGAGAPAGNPAKA